MKTIHVVGARPQFVKMAMVSLAITTHNRQVAQDDRIEELIIHTGQHYDYGMSRVFFDELEIPRPNYNLGIGSASQGAQTGRMLEAIETVLIDEQPDWVILYGDTNSTLAGALAAAKLHIPVAHVEAGLRSFNRRMPEEINRVLTDHASNVLFCPTEAAVKNLKREGFTNIVNDGHLSSDLQPLSLLATGSTSVRVNNELRATQHELRTTNYAPLVVNIGDVMYDSVLQNAKLAEQRSEILTQLHLKPKEPYELNKPNKLKGYALATVHRASNTDDPERLRSIFQALMKSHAVLCQ